MDLRFPSKAEILVDRLSDCQLRAKLALRSVKAPSLCSRERLKSFQNTHNLEARNVLCIINKAV